MIRSLKKLKIIINANVILDYDALFMSIKNIEEYNKKIDKQMIKFNFNEIFKKNVDIVKPRSHSIEFRIIKSRKINFRV